MILIDTTDPSKHIMMDMSNLPTIANDPHMRKHTVYAYIHTPALTGYYRKQG